MNRSLLGLFVTSLFFVGVASPSRAEDYSIDPAHSGVHFKISHIGLSWIYGRFNTYSGAFAVDPEDAGSGSGELGGSIACATAGVQHLLAAAETGGERVTGEMFIEEIGVNLSGDDALAGELSQACAPDPYPTGER